MDAIKPATETITDPAPERSWPKPVTEITYEVMKQYGGQWVAWAFDGETILTHGATTSEVKKKLVEAGFNPSRCVFALIDEPEMWN